MIDLFKKVFYLGLGAGVMARENAERTMNEMSDRGQEVMDEMRKASEEAMDEVKAELEKMQASGAEEFQRFADQAGLVTKADIKALDERLARIEALLAKQ